MSTSPALRAAARVVSSGMLRNTSRLTAGGLRQKPDRKSTRLNSSHSQISYAVFLFRKNTRLNSSHSQISYAVFCLKKKRRVDAKQNPTECTSTRITYRNSHILYAIFSLTYTQSIRK